MSGQWEVVGKKKDKANNKAPVQRAKDKKISNGVKVEEVLPKSQIKNLYLSSKNNKENQKPQEKPKPQESTTKKPHKKPEKPQESKPKMQKSIESALGSINVTEFNDIYEKNKTLFPDTPIVWLKELAQFLNLKVPVDVQDPVFGNKAENYPLSVMPSPIKNIIEKATKDAGPNNASVFFDICLTAMANDLNKDLTALGHRFFLQYLALKNPKLVVNSVSKYITLRNSYQNKQSVGLAILWALGQGGLKDLSVGMKVFQEIMLPLAEMKNYSRYVIKYLISIIKKHKDEALTKEQYLMILDIIFSSKKNVPTDLNKELVQMLPLLNEMVGRISSADKYSSYIDPFLKKISQSTNQTQQEQLCKVLVACIEHDQNCLGSWGKVYTKYLLASSVLLKYIEKNWKAINKNINKKVFAELLNTYSLTNDELMLKKRKEDGLRDSIELIKKLHNTMASGKKGSSFPLKTIIFWIVIPIALGLVYVDIKQNGSWNDSSVHRALNVSGVYKFTNQALDRAREGTVWLHTRIEEQFPGLTGRTVEFTTPYIELGRDLSILLCYSVCNVQNKINSKIPVILETIDAYAPGLRKNVQDGAVNGWNTVVVYCTRGKEYLLTEVFVGKLAPEEIQKSIIRGVDLSMQKATEYYHWIFEKVSSAIK